MHRDEASRGDDRAVMRVLRERGGTASRATLARALDISVATLARRLRAMVDAGQIQRIEPGTYQLAGDELRGVLEPQAAQVVQALATSGAEAHLTGYDLLIAHSHQFVRSLPHLVYADPAALDEVSFALSQAGFLPVPAGRQARNLLVHAPDLDRVVLLRGQSPQRMERLGVRSEIGPPEKAWLDLLRETRAGSLPGSLADLGAILASLLRSGADTPLLQRWAREMGYSRYVQAVLHPETVTPTDALDLQQLAAGATR